MLAHSYNHLVRFNLAGWLYLGRRLDHQVINLRFIYIFVYTQVQECAYSYTHALKGDDTHDQEDQEDGGG